MNTHIKHMMELQAIAQSGLAYCTDAFDIERYQRILDITAHLLALNSFHSHKKILELFEAESGYCTPKVDVRGAIFKEGKILLVQEKSDGLWSLPGGWADINLSPKENIEKEIREETGFNCTANKLIGVFDKQKCHIQNTKWPHVYKVLFLCDIDDFNQGGFDKNEVLSTGFFDDKNIPSLSETRVTSKEIDLCFKHFKNRLLPAKFD